MGIAAMILGIVSLIFCWIPGIGILGSMAAIVLGAISIAKRHRKAMGVVGLVFGIVAFLLSVSLFIAYPDIVARVAGTLYFEVFD